MRKITTILSLFIFVTCNLFAQTAAQDKAITHWVHTFEKEYPNVGKICLRSVKINDRTKTVTLQTGTNFASLFFTPELIERMYADIDSILPNCKNYKKEIYTNGELVNVYVPNIYRAEKIKCRLPYNRQERPVFIQNASLPYTISQGLNGRNIALWHSHGLYFKQDENRWRWQRARYFETVEDKLTASYVLQYLVPMLENAGATVLMPHERDIQTNEIIVDNDTMFDASRYLVVGDTSLVGTGKSGFARNKNTYYIGENPFEQGTYSTAKTAPQSSVAFAWVPNIPEDGEYAVSIAYKSLPNSVNDAHYIVYHAGGQTEFVVNQTMGGGTWIYLGKFYFKKGKQAKVVLTNKSQATGVVVADAVRFGGGMGNIARCAGFTLGNDTLRHSADESAYPRYMEAANYWLQWAGAPTSVYSYSQGQNDYVDDIASRGLWVNWLNNGSVNNSDSTGLHIPIDMSFCLHSDAGVKNDSVVGSLGIYSILDENSSDRFPTRQSRWTSHDLTQLVMQSIVNDLNKIGCNWSYRGMWNKKYAEVYRPQVPSMLLELFSHQNFTDMRYALDPRFKFVASRAIYKGILRYLSDQYGTEYCVQPLPITNFSAQIFGDSVQLAWSPTNDVLDSTATPTGYVVYTRIDDGGFDNGYLVNDTIVRLPLENDRILSYKIVAVNAGGASFPSEILSVCRSSQAKHTVLVVNGFDRVSAPEGVDNDDIAGFPSWTDDAVPYINDISYVGAQKEFRRGLPWIDNDHPGSGESKNDYEKRVVAGNTFDYAYLHGLSLVANGYSFVSCSHAAIERGDVQLSDYRIVDWILGKQKRCALGNNTDRYDFQTFNLAAQRAVTNYCLQGGTLLVSGSNIVSDLYNSPASTVQDKNFAHSVFHFKRNINCSSPTNQIEAVSSNIHKWDGTYEFCDTINEKQYAVESADAIEPDGKAHTIMRYAHSDMSAAIAYKGIYNLVVCGFPIESLTSTEQRVDLLHELLDILTEQRSANTEVLQENKSSSRKFSIFSRKQPVKPKNKQ